MTPQPHPLHRLTQRLMVHSGRRSCDPCARPTRRGVCKERLLQSGQTSHAPGEAPTTDLRHNSCCDLPELNGSEEHPWKMTNSGAALPQVHHSAPWQTAWADRIPQNHQAATGHGMPDSATQAATSAFGSSPCLRIGNPSVPRRAFRPNASTSCATSPNRTRWAASARARRPHHRARGYTEFVRGIAPRVRAEQYIDAATTPESRSVAATTKSARRIWPSCAQHGVQARDWTTNARMRGQAK